MSTRLQLVQALHREIDAAGSGPTATTNQTGEFQLLVDWVDNAWIEIQNRHPWRWLRRKFTLATTSGDDTYAFGDCTDVDAAAAISRFSYWHFSDSVHPPRIYLTSAGSGTETWLISVIWEQFSLVYKLGTQNNGYPSWITVDPQNNILLGPQPAGAYTITGDFYRGAQIFSADGDIPEMPTRFHRLIVYWAMKKYGRYRESRGALIAGEAEGDPMMRDLEYDQLEQPPWAGPLA